MAAASGTPKHTGDGVSGATQPAAARHTILVLSPAGGVVGGPGLAAEVRTRRASDGSVYPVTPEVRSACPGLGGAESCGRLVNQGHQRVTSKMASTTSSTSAPRLVSLIHHAAAPVRSIMPALSKSPGQF